MEEPTGASVVRQQVATEAAGTSLGCREVAMLLRGNLEQAQVVRSLARGVMHTVNITDCLHDAQPMSLPAGWDPRSQPELLRQPAPLPAAERRTERI